jgi:hypothetical protein
MPSPNFGNFESSLLRAGVAPRHVRRTVLELQEHLEDLVETEIGNGCNEHLASKRALQQMGDLQDVVTAMRARPELLGWAHRYPRVAVLVYPLTCLALLPVAPLFAGVAHAPQIARWSLCMMFAALVTSTIFLVLQLSILLA